MSGFGGFGSAPSGSGLFGAKPPGQPGTGFSMPTTTTVTTATGTTFGTPTFGTGGGTGLFGTQQQTPTLGTGFGIKTTTTTTGFTFGSPAGNTPTFGIASTTTPASLFGASNTTSTAFGTPASTSTAPTFGMPTSSTAAPTFGVPTSTTAAPTFGMPTSNAAAPTFGTFGTSNAPTFGFNMATPKTTNSILPQPSTTTSSTPGMPTFNFGVTSTTTTTTPTISFGISTTSTTTTAGASAPVQTPSFGVPATGTTSTALPSSTTTTTTATTSATGFTFTQPSGTSALTFGTPKAGFSFGTTTTTTSTTTATTTTTTGLTFNLGTSTTTAPSLGTGLFGAPKTDNLTITTTSIGLGGVNNAQNTTGLSGSGPMEPKQAKDHALPDPILQTLNDFQNFTKQQKSISVEISHGSSKPLKKVQEDTEAIESLLTTIKSGLTKNAIAVDKLKTETAQGLHQAEMAQRNHEAPPGLHYDSSAPSDYFNDLVAKFETDTVRLRSQIEASEKHLKSLTQCTTISPQELTLAMRRLHETLIVLAARVQTLHTTVQSQKEQFKNLRRVYFKDDTNIFESGADQTRTKKQTVYSLRSLTGPTPFSETHGAGIPLNVDGLAMLASSAGASASVPTTSTNSSWMSPLQGSPNPGFATPAGLLGNFPAADMTGFQLGNPPAGNKRSKR